MGHKPGLIEPCGSGMFVAAAAGAGSCICFSFVLVASVLAMTPIGPFSVFFDSGEAELRKISKVVLDTAARVRVGHELEDWGYVIEGYSDSSGPSKLNLALALKRAEAVRSFLIERGVPAECLRIEAHGEDRSPSPAERLDPQNQRTVIISVDGLQPPSRCVVPPEARSRFLSLPPLSY